MGKQHKKVVKRNRRQSYLKRKKEQDRVNAITKKSAAPAKKTVKKAAAKKTAAKKTVKKAATKKAAVKKVAKKATKKAAEKKED